MIELETVKNAICRDSNVKLWTEKGWCRLWSDKAMDVLEGMMDNFVNVEAREVEISPDFWHTFVSGISVDGDVYFFDGVGCGKNGPFFGREVDAPEYLRGGKRDNRIMIEREAKKKYVDKNY